MLHVILLQLSLISFACLIRLTDAALIDTFGVTVDLDLNNITAAQHAIDDLCEKYVPPPQQELPKKLLPQLATHGFSLIHKSSLENRASCSGNQQNFCFPDPNSYCSNCGVCCTQAAGAWCCVDPNATCCPAATANGGSGCCVQGQICDSNLGCIWPTVTITVTTTVWSTQTLFITVYDTSLTTVTVTSTDISIFLTTTSAQTATVVDSTTTKLARRAHSTLLESGTVGTASLLDQPKSGVAKTMDDKPTVTLLMSPNLDSIQHKLEQIGFLVKRDSTSTSTVFVTVSATTTVVSSVTSGGVATATSTIITSAVFTSVSFIGADTTVHVTSTVTSNQPGSISLWNGSGNLLQGDCATPQYTILNAGVTRAVWVPIVGCVDEKPNCCPYSLNTAAETTQTLTSSSGSIPLDFPGAAIPSQATLGRCPADYQAVSSGCCPSGYDLWNAILGGETPCFSPLSTYLTAPPIPSSELASAAAAASQPISSFSITTIVDIVYAMHYPVTPQPTPLSTGAKVGIGVGSTIAGLAIGVLGILLLWQRRKHKKRLESGRGSSANHTGVFDSWADYGAAAATLPTSMGYESTSGRPVSAPNGNINDTGYSVPRRSVGVGVPHQPQMEQQYRSQPSNSPGDGPPYMYPMQPAPQELHSPQPGPQELHNPALGERV